MSEKPVALIWYRRDLRVSDHAPLLAAIERGYTPVPVFVWAPGEESPWAPGGASRRWLHAALADLDDRLRQLGSRLILRAGPTAEAFQHLVRETGAKSVYWHRRYEPEVIARDTSLKAAWKASGLDVESFAGDCLFEPHTVKNKAGGPFKVFTPYWRHCLASYAVEPAKQAPGKLPAPAQWPESAPLASFGLLPEIPWDSGIAKFWEITRAGGEKRLAAFLGRAAAPSAAVANGAGEFPGPGPAESIREIITLRGHGGRGVTRSAIDDYEEHRDIPGIDGTSRLSPYLHFGQISAREAFVAARLAGGVGEARFLAELGWREFGRHLLFHFPKTPEAPLDSAFEKFPWVDAPELLEAWRRGRTGIPIIDAGMRQLWETGWMHNRVRMVAGSFLVKNLLLDWRHGAAWFMDTLVDADLAQNTMGWQWVAGCGADAAPFFRVFNPVLQGEKFDPDGDYVRRYVPELARVPMKWIHHPWDAPLHVLAASGVVLGVDYPEPVTGLALSRARALDAYARLRA